MIRWGVVTIPKRQLKGSTMMKRAWMIPFALGALLVAGFAMQGYLSHAAVEGEPSWEAPLGLPAVPIPADNPMTVEKVELGKMLYFDKRLSIDGTVSCATCHKPDYAYAEPRATSEGIDGLVGERNSPSVINTAYFTTMFWDGRAKSMEEQAAGPMENPIEMGHDIAVISKQLNEIPEYKAMFQTAFGEPASKETITKAIAAFERTVLSGNSPYDQYMNGDQNAMGADAIAGMNLFRGKALCATCHTPPLFSNGNFVNAGIGMDKEEPDAGRMLVTNSPSDMGAFRVAPLREVEHTSPYFHDGSVESLEEAVRIMAEGGIDNPNIYPVFRAVPELSDEEIGQLVEFLMALSGEYPIYKEPKLP